MSSPLTVPGLLHALIDDAAVFPPGSAPLAEAIALHRHHRHARYADALGPLLVPADSVGELLELAAPTDDVSVGVIARPGVSLSVADQAARLVAADPRLHLASLDVGWSDDLDTVLDAAPILAVEIPRGEQAGTAMTNVERLRGMSTTTVLAKFRTGCTPTWPWPEAAELAGVILDLVRRGLAFKLTGGLHHAVRQRIAAEEHHGLLNVILAVVAAQAGADQPTLAAILERRDGAGLAREVGNLGAGHVARMRRLFTSYGCCTVLDPLTELAKLGCLAPALIPEETP
ncbi:MAG: hypothetical protein ACK5MP_07045 [Nostocoides sp.]